MQRQLSNSRWVDASEKFIARAAAYNGVSESEIINRLANGQEIKYDVEWYAYIRKLQPRVARSARQMEICDCGHSVPQGQAMTTARGTACANCYDSAS